jgi:hypothetical protein
MDKFFILQQSQLQKIIHKSYQEWQTMNGSM